MRLLTANLTVAYKSLKFTIEREARAKASHQELLLKSHLNLIRVVKNFHLSNEKMDEASLRRVIVDQVITI